MLATCSQNWRSLYFMALQHVYGSPTCSSPAPQVNDTNFEPKLVIMCHPLLQEGWLDIRNGDDILSLRYKSTISSGLRTIYHCQRQTNEHNWITCYTDLLLDRKNR